MFHFEEISLFKYNMEKVFLECFSVISGKKSVATLNRDTLRHFVLIKAQPICHICNELLTDYGT